MNCIPFYMKEKRGRIRMDMLKRVADYQLEESMLKWEGTFSD
ncbi:hypothetical protein JMA_12790 [Jeotgalibacillus malaysiensis]|uniref:Uncharacterized protein n=1 Tax=Jeotgalibacillus malaysiensis TaxID=1508404 RepID=A0A0B5AKM1_9BACL|nr:hypothetical protein JMA_12790 [Jeotgalibacillus malaysiensis]